MHAINTMSIATVHSKALKPETVPSHHFLSQNYQ